ncbi:uncharacterized protein N0V89_008222 [Didymosphaeria variabile]|uniref:Uncharacterized protein n=1 Tax=Didymosphaeria variabile TaxID=1932322 RepID=A0A9W8XHP8_9PLEO|nr:uncharacterized protein N0V89_008222 [Didymosphaeria variabile]KAJ4349606.1 hypothetical protein N0V89_008222 [Didymosphaeria variabile]
MAANKPRRLSPSPQRSRRRFDPRRLFPRSSPTPRLRSAVSTNSLRAAAGTGSTPAALEPVRDALPVSPRTARPFGEFHGAPTTAVTWKDIHEETDSHNDYGFALHDQAQTASDSSRQHTRVRFADDERMRAQDTERKKGKFQSLFPFRTREKDSGKRTAALRSHLPFRSMVNLAESGSHSDFHRRAEGDSFDRFLDEQPFYQRLHPERFTPSPQPHARNRPRVLDTNMLSRNDEASQSGDRALSRNTQRASSNSVLDIIEGYQEQRSSATSMPLTTTAPNLSRLADPDQHDLSEVREEAEEQEFVQRGYVLPSFTSLARPVALRSHRPSAPVLDSVPARDQQLEKIEEAIARIVQTDERARNMTDAENESLRKRTDRALLMAADMAEEKSRMDTEVASLKKSHKLFTQQANQLVSRWSPDSSLTSVSSRDLIDAIPSDEEPEICEADVAVCYPVTKIPAGTVRVVGRGRPAVNKRQREEMAAGQDSQSTQVADNSVLDKSIQNKPSMSELKRVKAPIALNKGGTEPFPMYIEHFKEGERRKNLGMPRDESQDFTQTWVDRHVDVKERPVSIACDQDVRAERAIPPAPFPKDGFNTTHATSMSPMRAPPKPPSRTPPRLSMTPLRIPPIPARSPLRQSSLPSPTAVPLPSSPVPPFRRAPVRGKPTSSFGQPSVLRSTPPRIQLPAPASSVSPTRSSSLQAPTRKHCVQGGHTFRPMNLHEVPDNVEMGRIGVSPYLNTQAGVMQQVDGSICCEKCGDNAEVYMQCELPECSLSVCFDCALMIQAEGERKRIDAWHY